MKKMTVIKAACGGLFIGANAVAMLINYTRHSPVGFTISNIAGILAGLALLVAASREGK